MVDEPGFLSATQIAERIKKRELSAVDVLEMYFDRIDRFNPKINAIVWEDRDSAITFAKACDGKIAKDGVEDLPPLFGVPMTVKEHFNIKGSPSCMGAPEQLWFTAEEDGLAVKLLRSAGVNVFGKSNMPYYGIDLQAFNDVYGTTLNPWSDALTPGGSSGGSGAALAAGLTGIELGSDLGASIRYPAHCCGIFGLKPTIGTFITGQSGPVETGVYPTIATGGPMARSAQDLRAAFSVLAGHRPDYPSAWTLDCPHDNRTLLKDFKIGVKLSDPVSNVDRPYVEALETFVEKLRQAGVQVTETNGPDINGDDYFNLYWKIAAGERAIHEPEGAAQHWVEVERALTEPVNPRFWQCRHEGYQLSFAQYQQLLVERMSYRRIFDAFMSDFDILITPVAASRAFPHDQDGQRWHRTIDVNGKPMAEMEQIFWAAYPGVIGLPAVVGPAGFDRGIPVGYQAIAGYGKDLTAIAFAEAAEKEIKGFEPPPSVSA